MSAGPGAKHRKEVWPRAALLLLATVLGGYLYLGTRPGGRTPIWFFHQGRLLLALVSLALTVFAVAWCATHRPFFRDGRRLGFIALFVSIGLAQWPLPYPSSREQRPSSVRFHLPVEGEWVVVHGGDDRESNLLSILTHDRRFGLALVRVQDGSTRREEEGSDRTPEGALAWGEPVHAAAAGKVVRVRDDIPEDGEAGDGRVPQAGNVVVIQVAEGEFLFTTHLLAGSIPVRPGDEVEAGALLGRVGSSGRLELVREPHVAIHLQTTPDDHWGEAIPWSFSGYVADGLPVERGVPRGGLSGGRPAGQRVRPRD